MFIPHTRQRRVPFCLVQRSAAGKSPESDNETQSNNQDATSAFGIFFSHAPRISVGNNAWLSKIFPNGQNLDWRLID